MVLRHRFRQVSTLHVYHHASMLILSEMGYKKYAWAAFAMPLTLNALVIMQTTMPHFFFPIIKPTFSQGSRLLVPLLRSHGSRNAAILEKTPHRSSDSAIFNRLDPRSGGLCQAQLLLLVDHVRPLDDILLRIVLPQVLHGGPKAPWQCWKKASMRLSDPAINPDWHFIATFGRFLVKM